MLHVGARSPRPQSGGGSAAVFLCGSGDPDEVAFGVGEMADDQGAIGRLFRPHRPDPAEPLSLEQRRFYVGHADAEQNAAGIAGA
jgi:hypothetical protein